MVDSDSGMRAIEYASVPPLQRSGVGIASFYVAVAATATLVAVWCSAIEGRPASDVMVYKLLGLTFILPAVGTVLGMVSMFQRQRFRGLPIAGLTINVLLGLFVLLAAVPSLLYELSWWPQQKLLQEEFVMSIAFWCWWIPNALAAVGLGVCIVQGVRRHSLGLCLFAVYFAYSLATSVIVAIRKHQQDAEYARHFVQQQIGPNTWTVPVLHQDYNLAAPFTSALLVLVAILFARSLAARRAA